MTNLIPCPGWTSEEDQSAHKCGENRADPALMTPSSTSCRRCRTRKDKYDKDHGRAARAKLEQETREAARMELWLKDLRGVDRFKAPDPASLVDLIAIIETLPARSPYPPYDVRDYGSTYSFDRAERWAVLRAYVGLPPLPKGR